MIGMEWMWWMVWGILWMLIPILLVVGLVVLLVRRRPSQSRRPSAVRILEERYARGEIDRDEYLERRAVLEERR
jgi:putative membrane protein